MKHKAYPAREAGGFVWCYMGPADEMPEFEPPAFAPTPDARVSATKVRVRCNWAQILEGQIDSAHSSSLHSSDMVPAQVDGAKATDANWLRPSTDKAPRFQIERTSYGFRYAAIRRPIQNEATHDYIRTTVYIAPFTALIPPNNVHNVATLLTPEDDHTTIFYFIAWNGADKPGIDADAWRKFNVLRMGRRRRCEFRRHPHARERLPAGPRRHEGRQLHRHPGHSQPGHRDVGRHGADQRSHARSALGASDVAVVAFRRLMVEAARTMQNGGPAIGTTSAARAACDDQLLRRCSTENRELAYARRRERGDRASASHRRAKRTKNHLGGRSMKATLAAALGALALFGGAASAQDTIKLAIGQRGNWDTSVSEIGQRAGIFKKHGLVLDIVYTQGAGETQQAVISGSVDIGIAAGVMGVLSAYSKGAPVRVIAAETTGAGDLYWYVKADSPIKTLKDTDGKTLAYSTNGSSTHGVVTAFMKQYDLKAKPTAMGGPAANLTAVMSGQVDVGWAAPPFGLDQLDKGDIRRIATGNDAAVFKGQTVRLNIANASYLAAKKDVVARYMKAYRETVDYMYKDPEGLKIYAEWLNISRRRRRSARATNSSRRPRSSRTRSSGSTRS